MSTKFKAKLYRSIQLKVFSEDGGHERFTLNPQAGRVFTPDGVEKAKSDFALLLKGQFPDRYFRFVKVRANAFNVLPIAEKSPDTVAAGEC